MDKRVQAMRLIGKLSLEGKITATTPGNAEFLDDCVQLYTGCRFAEQDCTHDECKT